jgi:hypothetical protein
MNRGVIRVIELKRMFVGWGFGDVFRAMKTATGTEGYDAIDLQDQVKGIVFGI